MSLTDRHFGGSEAQMVGATNHLNKLHFYCLVVVRSFKTENHQSVFC